MRKIGLNKILFCPFLLFLTACATPADMYRDPKMDFGAIQTVAVMPFTNLAKEQIIAERVRDVFITNLLSTGAVYVLPVGEVARGISKVEMANPGAPSPEEVIKVARIVQAQAVITGVVREYGEVRAGITSANLISMSLQMIETQTGKVIWSASSTAGGISVWDRLFGGGGQPMNKVTEKAVNDLIQKLFK
jgi:hypothetical protein